MYKIYNKTGGFWGEVEHENEAIEVCAMKGDGYRYESDEVEEEEVSVVEEVKVATVEEVKTVPVVAKKKRTRKSKK